MSIFHLAIPTHDIEAAKIFYHQGLGAAVGREYPRYVIFNFFGHQVVCHHNPDKIDQEVSMYPRHFGIIFEDREIFDSLYQRAQEAGLEFYEPMFERLKDKPGRHWTFFLTDPSNNLIEFKFYENDQSIFSK